LTDTFCAECPQMMGQIRDAITRSDAKLLQRAAHSLRGSAELFAATRLVDWAERLEKLGRAGTLETAEAAWPSLEAETAALISALREGSESASTSA
jgi:HPt (histidine-containing phosphotransfer) domain-containing protein